MGGIRSERSLAGTRASLGVHRKARAATSRTLWPLPHQSWGALGGLWIFWSFQAKAWSAVRPLEMMVLRLGWVVGIWALTSPLTP